MRGDRRGEARPARRAAPPGVPEPPPGGSARRGAAVRRRRRPGPAGAARSPVAETSPGPRPAAAAGSPGAATPPALRARVAADPYGRRLGIELLELRPGHCRAALRLTPDLVNFHGGPHGGAIFSLADFAFAGACNGHGEPAVALTV